MNVLDKIKETLSVIDTYDAAELVSIILNKKDWEDFVELGTKIPPLAIQEGICTSQDDVIAVKDIRIEFDFALLKSNICISFSKCSDSLIDETEQKEIKTFYLWTGLPVTSTFREQTRDES